MRASGVGITFTQMDGADFKPDEPEDLDLASCICQLVKIFLEFQEYDVVAVSDGKEAYKVWDQGNFDLILMDINARYGWI